MDGLIHFHLFPLFLSKCKKVKRILVTGAYGQIGTVLTEALREKYGVAAVLATDLHPNDAEIGAFELLDILDEKRLREIVDLYEISEIYHLAAVLSAVGEKNPRLAWKVNMEGLMNVLEVAKDNKLRVFFPSSIAAFGGASPKDMTPQDAIMQPQTVYGISKVASENWCSYYHENYGVDVRSVRYPGIIGYQSLPGGGTTDYAVEIFHKAIAGDDYACFLKEDATMPMMYMDDAIHATIELMEAPLEQLTVRTSYNIAAFSFSPLEISNEIRKYFPDFKVSYIPDFRQKIADSWPRSIDDSIACRDWNWQPKFTFQSMVKDMIEQLQVKSGHHLINK